MKPYCECGCNPATPCSCSTKCAERHGDRRTYLHACIVCRISSLAVDPTEFGWIEVRSEWYCEAHTPEALQELGRWSDILDIVADEGLT